VKLSHKIVYIHLLEWSVNEQEMDIHKSLVSGAGIMQKRRDVLASGVALGNME
jgi:hypothetical protein